MINVNQLFCNICKSSHYAIHLKLNTLLYVSYISKLKEKKSFELFSIYLVIVICSELNFPSKQHGLSFPLSPAQVSVVFPTASVSL